MFLGDYFSFGGAAAGGGGADAWDAEVNVER